MYVYVCFDVEDLVHPDSDDVPRDIADMLADAGIVASMCVVGEKARLWERRGRHDVIAAVGKHDVSLHTDRHSMHPTVAEYLADKDWASGVAEAIRREGRGATDLACIFGTYPSTWGTGGSSWGPQIPAATSRLGIPSNIYTHACLENSGAWWFAGQLCFPNGVSLRGGEDTCCDDQAFESALPGLLTEIEALIRSEAPCVLLFGGHPTRFRYTRFWDTINYARGKNTEPAYYEAAPRRPDAAYAAGLRNLRRMILAVQDVPGVRMTSVRALNGRFGAQNGPVAWQEVCTLAETIACETGIATDNPTASPAEALDLLARAILRVADYSEAPEYLLTRTVLGPVEPPPTLHAPVTVDQGEELDVCRRLANHVDTTGRLPAALEVGASATGPGPMLKAVAQWFLTLSSRLPFDKGTIFPGPDEPTIAPRLADEQIYRSLPHWPPHDPDLDLENLALHLRLQSWSLKPAKLGTE